MIDTQGPQSPSISRRKFIAAAVGAPAVLNSPIQSSAHAAPSEANRDFGFGFSLYGMKKLPIDEALRNCKRIGYDCIELPTMSDWPGAPEGLSASSRQSIRNQLRDLSIRLSAMMENVVLLANGSQHLKNTDRLKAAGQLARDLGSESPVIETIMGGKPDEWDSVRHQMVDRLGEWAQAAKEVGSTIAIKAHVAGAAHLPEHVRWLLDQVKNPALQAAFDFSHFQLRGIALADAWRTLAKETVFIHIKDSNGELGKFQFVLPGEGTIDYVDYFKLLKGANCHADVVVEVSGQIHNRSGYDPIEAATKSYPKVAEACHRAGIVRG